MDTLFRFAANHFAHKQKWAIDRALAGIGLDAYNPIIEGAAREMGLSVDPTTVAGRLVARTILRGYATYLEEQRAGAAQIARAPSQSGGEIPKVLAPFIFTKHWDDFEKHKLAVREWKADTAANASGSRTVFDRIFPEVTVDRLVAEPTALNFKSTLLQLPRHHARGDRANMTVDQLIASAKKLPLSERVQKATVNKHLNNLLGYWDYLVSQKKIAADLDNPFKGLHMPKAKGKKARDERYNWPKSLEKVLFESPLYTGSLSIHRRAIPGQEIHRDALFWMPLLARTMGARENELCDAFVRDVCFQDTEEGQISYLAVTDGKDTGSARDIPFADLILEMGFLEQRVIGRDLNEPLFPELIPQGPGQRRSAAFSDRFAYYRHGIKVHRPRIDFHSFRGNVETDLKNTEGINTAWIDELIGHESIVRRSEGDRYTKKIHLPILRRLVNSISIEAELGHLRYTGERGLPDSDRHRDIANFVRLAEREMAKKKRSKAKAKT